MSRIGKFIEMGGGLMIAWGWGHGGSGEKGVIADECRLYFWVNKNYLYLDCGGGWTKKHFIVHFKWVSCMLHELYLKVVLKSNINRVYIINVNQSNLKKFSVIWMYIPGIYSLKTKRQKWKCKR